MFELKILKPKGVVYWKQNFYSMDDLNKWLEIEKSRPYWNPNFTIDIVDNSEKVLEKRRRVEAEIMAQEKKHKELKKSLKEFKKRPVNTADQCADAIKTIIEILRLE